LRAPKLISLERQRIFQAHAALLKQFPLPDKRLDELFHCDTLLKHSGGIWHDILNLPRRRFPAGSAGVTCSLHGLKEVAQLDFPLAVPLSARSNDTPVQISNHGNVINRDFLSGKAYWSCPLTFSSSS